MNNVCVKCGERLAEGASFCGSCGAAVVRAAKTSPSAKPAHVKHTGANQAKPASSTVVSQDTSSNLGFQIIGIIVVWAIAIAIVAGTAGFGLPVLWGAWMLSKWILEDFK